ncbi:MAG: hypothetical protein JWR25_417 [Noviherbaspirillum sp.]|nr:hypothetical protein [Noviherbaspirillum sp.]
MVRSKSSVVALAVSVLAFFSSYYYCYMSFGLLTTYCLGWLPSWIAAYWASAITRCVWHAASIAFLRSRALVLVALASVISNHP